MPIRLPWTQLVQEKLPAGSAGVPLNRSHQFHDLIRVLDPQEKRWFDGIDGRRSVTEIVDHRGAPDRDRAHTFIERLWWYDQVVSDASDAREVDSG